MTMTSKSNKKTLNQLGTLTLHEVNIKYFIIINHPPISPNLEASNKYAIIPPAIRMAFLNRVLTKQSTIKEAAQEFGIKFSTSKAILQTYRKEGRIGKKQFRIRKKKENEQKFTSLNQFDQAKPNINPTKQLHSAPFLDNPKYNQDKIQTLLHNPVFLGSLMDGLKKRELLQQQITINHFMLEIAKEKEKQKFLIQALNQQHNLNDEFIQIKEEENDGENSPFGAAIQQEKKISSFNLDKDPTVPQL